MSNADKPAHDGGDAGLVGVAQLHADISDPGDLRSVRARADPAFIPAGEYTLVRER
jgi:hypothetical protein